MPLSEAKMIRPSEQPDRDECVIAFATDGFNTKWRVWSIKRDGRGRITAVTPKTDDDDKMNDANMSSWLTNLLGGYGLSSGDVVGSSSPMKPRSRAWA